MQKIIEKNSPGEDNFKSINDFKDCIIRGGEIEFIYDNKIFGISYPPNNLIDFNKEILISQVCIENPEETEMWCDTADEILEYIIDGVKLRDIITKVEVTYRTI